MKREEVLKLAGDLNKNGSVLFKDENDIIYDIWTASEEGYHIDTYCDGEGVDGGLCTGNAVDAITFLMGVDHDEKL